MRKVMIAALAAAMAAGVAVRAQHAGRVFDGDDPSQGDEIDLTPRKVKPPPDPKPIYLPAPRVEHKAKSKALARLLKSKGRK